ncbi:MAG: hypothetical protein NZO58_05355 [Gemmataceae bacterium]|nr:hypothetical protein [Gemmataceae bacterium]
MAEDVAMFRAALHARPTALVDPSCKAVLVALDGSNQDTTAQTYAAALAGRFGARVHEHRGATTAAEILQAAVEHQVGLIAVPVPFGRDISELRDESLGFVVDMLLQEAHCPVLCVREPVEAVEVDAALADLVVAATHEDQYAVRALSWACRLTARGGRLTLLAVADRDALEEVRLLVAETISSEALAPAALDRAMAQQFGGLIAALQRRGEADGFALRVEFRVGRVAETVLTEANPRRRLIVTGAPREHQALAHHHAVDLVLGARGAVLVV